MRAVFLVGLVAGASWSGSAAAAGFALKEQSATAQGNAFAGATSAAEDASFMFFNPAALGWLEGPYQVQAVTTVIVPRLKLGNAKGTTALGTSIGGHESQQDIGEDAVVPAIYGAMKLSERWTVGIGINAPFGLATDYAKTWVGRYHGVDSSLQTVNINPAVSWRPLPKLTLGLGLQAQYADADLTSAIDFGTIGASLGIPGSVPAGQDGFVRATGNDWSYGYTLGALLEPMPGTRLGIGYRSSIEHRLRGKADFSTGNSPPGQAISAATGQFQDTGTTAKLTTPASLSFGIHQDINSRLAVMAEAAWTNWSSFDELRLQFDNTAQPDSVTEDQWNDSWFLAIGATWRATDALTLRLGAARDQSPVRNRYRTPRIPDGDRTWLSVGVGWDPARWLAIDASFAHVIGQDTDVSLRTDGVDNGPRGNLDAAYDTSVELFSVAARFIF